MKALVIICALCMGSAHGQGLVDIGDGSQIAVFPTGAYVPNTWINEAVDTSNVWRMGNALSKVAVRQIASMSRENLALKEQRDSLAAADRMHTNLLDTCDHQWEQADLHLTDCSDKVARLKPWATTGKISVGLTLLFLTVGAVRQATQP